MVSAPFLLQVPSWLSPPPLPQASCRGHRALAQTPRLSPAARAAHAAGWTRVWRTLVWPSSLGTRFKRAMGLARSRTLWPGPRAKSQVGPPRQVFPKPRTSAGFSGCAGRGTDSVCLCQMRCALSIVWACSFCFQLLAPPRATNYTLAFILQQGFHAPG